jgi:hypothetical protein
MEKEGKKSQDNRNSSHAILTTKAVNPQRFRNLANLDQLVRRQGLDIAGFTVF